MPKRPFQVLSSAQSASLGPVAAGNVYVGYPRPIEVGDRKRLVKLADPQGKVCVSGWSSYEVSKDVAAPRLSDSIPPLLTQPSTALSSAQLSEDEGTAASATSSDLQQLKQHIRQQQRLREVERRLRSTLEPTSILSTAVIEIAALFGATHVSVLKHCSETQTFHQAARYCGDEDQDWESPLSLSQVSFPQFWKMLREGKLLRIFADQLMSSVAGAEAPFSELSAAKPNQLSVAKNADHESQQWLARWSGNWLLLPVSNAALHDLPDSGLSPKDIASIADSALMQDALQAAPGETSHESGGWGLLALSIPKREVWTDDAISAAQSIAVELSLAIAHSQQYQALVAANQALQKLALSDGLTSLANRRRFDEHLADEWQRLARDRHPLSLILCDLDHFKLYNDTFGHPAGDRCLIRVARALLNGPQRPADLVARYGGEEFAIILPNTDTHGAWRIAQKIHESIRALKIPHAEDSENEFVTVTMGVSTVIPGHDSTPQMLVQASDLALYHAKQHGRNRTYVNGHYNTVNTRDASPPSTNNHCAAADQPAVMPMEASDD